MAILAVNAGSSTLKFSVHPLQNQGVLDPVLIGNIQGLEPAGQPRMDWTWQGQRHQRALPTIEGTPFERALHALHDHGVSVPDDVIVTGFDDVEFSRYTSPSLTTIAFDRRAFADAALGLLESRMDDRSTPPRALTLSHHLLERDSTQGTPRGYRA